MKRFLLLSLIPLSAVIIFAFLELTLLLKPIEQKLYDFALALRPDVSEDKAILLLDVDDEAIERSKTMWPWPRDYMATGLLLLKEYGARLQVFDILYEQASPPGVNLAKVGGAVDAYDRLFKGLKDDFRALAEAVASGSLPPAELRYVAPEYLEMLERARHLTKAQLEQIAEDRDSLLGKAAKVFGNSFFPVNIPANSTGRAEGIDQDLLSKAFVDQAQGEEEIVAKTEDLIFPIKPVLEGAKKLGFPTIKPDEPDGVTRRIDLFYNYRGRAVPQLGLVALLDYLGNPECKISREEVVLKGALNNGTGLRQDIRIPLTEEGMMLINWPKKGFSDSFRHLSFFALLNHDRLWNDIIYNTQLLANLEYEGRLKLQSGPAFLLAEYYEPLQKAREDLLSENNPQSAIERLRDLRAKLLAALQELFKPAGEETLIQALHVKDVQEKAELTDLIRAVFQANRERLLPAFLKVRQTLGRELKGSLCFTSWTSTSTTDIGVNPFHSEYVNVGTHAAVVNTILSGQFLDESPRWLTLLLLVALTALVYGFVFGLKQPLLSVLAGSGIILLSLAAFILVFAVTGLYLRLVAPFLSAFVTFLVFTVINFIITAREKNFIRHAFAHYLSQEVINDIIADPSRLNLGGESKFLTALFTDIKGFSALSEQLEPTALVTLLNYYLTAMSDIILDLSGTIDKYIGDAIVSFFGAPLSLPQHALHACLAAVRMKKTERQINERLLQEGRTTQPLLTRIGINTGEMIVGNMGTTRKFNYTIMGHNVNLAARLEGVNKQYGTQILVSEVTFQETGDRFLLRKLDRVRVVGINQPLRIYELLDEKAQAHPLEFELVETFHQGLAAFEERDWDRALGFFNQALKIKPQDGPALTFKSRVEQYKKSPPPAAWDGVFNLTTK